MKTIGSILLKGLVTILPIGLTVYFVYWLGVTTESAAVEAHQAGDRRCALLARAWA